MSSRNFSLFSRLDIASHRALAWFREELIYALRLHAQRLEIEAEAYRSGIR
ncbi:MAG: hypothetical protein ACRYG5_15760 [Janthinobacterium lividum]